MHSNTIVRKSHSFELGMLKAIMYNEEIIRREALGFDYERAFLIYKYMHIFDNIIKPLFKKSIVFYLLEIDGAVIGGLRCLIYWNKKIANIGYVSIEKKHRNRGYGSFLISEVLERLDVLGIKKARLTVDADNLTAINIYINIGFTICGDEYIIPKDIHFNNVKTPSNIFKILFNDYTICANPNDFIGIDISHISKSIHVLVMERIII